MIQRKLFRRLAFICCSALFAAALFFHGQQKKYGDDPLPVLTCSDAAPFSFYDGHRITGYDIDLIRHVGQKMNRKIHIIELPFGSLMAKLCLCLGRESELAISAITPTQRRQKYIDLSVPYCTSRTVLVVPEQSDIQTWMDVENKKLAVRRDTIQEDFARSKWQSLVKNLSLDITPIFDDGTFRRLEQRNIHGIITSQEEARIFMIRYGNLRIVDVPKTEHPYCIALHKRSPLTPQINKALLELKKDGTLAKIEAKWFSDRQIAHIALSSTSPRNIHFNKNDSSHDEST